MSTQNEVIRARLQADMDKFFSTGGEVQQCTSADNKNSRLQLKMKPKDGRLYYVAGSARLSDYQVRSKR